VRNAIVEIHTAHMEKQINVIMYVHTIQMRYVVVQVQIQFMKQETLQDALALIHQL